MKIFAAFTKFEKRDDGTLMVQGVASSEAVDSDGEIVKADAMRDALPGFMSLGTGALRSMHQAIAAGTVQKAEVRDDNKTYIEAEVVDPVEVLKVEKGVYKGFSIGGSVQKKEGKIIHKIKLREISLVDRGSNPEALLSLMKLEGTEEDEPVAKGMDHVAQLAWTLKSIGYLTEDQINEAAREGDASPIPAKLKAWLAAGAGILAEMTAEETAELVAALPEAKSVDDPLAMVDPAGELEKKGARHSAADKDHLQAIHDHAANMGADCAASKAEPAGDLAKVQAEHDLAKAQIETLTKALDDSKTETETLTKRVLELEAQPESPRGATADLPGIVLDKSQDNRRDNADQEEAVKKIETLPEGAEKAKALIQLIHSGVQVKA